MRVHSLLSPKCRVQRSPIHGSGVFAAEAFEKGELIAVWGGKVYTTEECGRLAEVFPHFATHPITLCEGYYLGSENLFELDDAELFNHSCDPNAGVKGQVILVARRAIRAGEELTFDYETTSDSAEDFTCRCGSPSCRRVLDGNAWRSPDFRSRNAGYLSWHIQELIWRAGVQQ